MVHYRVYKIPPLDPILSQPNSVHTLDPYLPKDHVNVILPPPSGIFRSGLPIKTL